MKNNIQIIFGRIIPDSKKLHQNQEVYCVNGIAATLKATSYKEPPKILLEVGDEEVR